MPNDSHNRSESGQTAHVPDARMLHDMIVGGSDEIAHVRRLVTTAAPTSLPVLIQGPTGAGKEVIATALHAMSGRRGNLVAFNVCAISESMFEDALFGHVRGAFTGAVTDARGLLLEGNGGTVVLDEIGSLPQAMQVKILRAIETKRFRPLGGRQDVSSDFRIVAATNEDLRDLVARKLFREDLAHRLGGIVIRVPPLCERRKDIMPLVRHFLQGDQRTWRIDADAVDLLEEYAWPGNVRELKQIVEWAASWNENAITRESLICAFSTRLGGAQPRNHMMIAQTALVAALEKHAWDMQAVARELQIHRATVYRQMRRLGLRPKRHIA